MYPGSSICLLLIFVGLGEAVSTLSGQPHIIFFLTDDMGWNDVGYHGSNQIPTPNIDALCYNGVILNNFYSQPICTPSRASLMTGKYPIKTGTQGMPLGNLNPSGLPLREKLLPQYMKELGYSTHAVGKWHLGMARTAQLPTKRGFDSHFGYRGGFTSYYEYVHHQDSSNAFGFDLYRNTTPSWEDVGTYATDLYTREAVSVIKDHERRKPLFLYLAHLGPHAGNDGKPLEAPLERVLKMDHIIDINRRTYAAMVSKVDDSLGKVVQALKDNDMLDNSIIVFASDNGAPTIGQYQNWGSNWPYRGIKYTLWEGGVKMPACIWGRQIRDTPRVSNDLMHVSDWMPTIISAAGGYRSILPYDIDGIDQWISIVDNRPSPRTEVLLNIDEVTRTAAYRRGAWKLVLGSVLDARFNNFLGEEGTNNKHYVHYDIAAISSSDVSESLSTVQRVASPAEISRLRDLANVRCLWRNQTTCSIGPGKHCLFDLEADPCEQRDLSTLYPRIVKQLKSRLIHYKTYLIPQIPRKIDNRGDPARFNNTYHPWLDNCIVNCDT